MTECLARARAGEAIVVGLEGAPGLGKTALLRHFAATAAIGEHVLWLPCDRRERDVDFAAAEVLLGAALPDEHSELHVGRQLLNRLGDLGKTTILLIDDAHWMDPPSARALRFALRRLQVEPLLAVVAQQPGSSGARGLETVDPASTVALRLGPLDASAVRELAVRMRAWDVPEATAARLVELTGGVPLLLASVLRRAPELGSLIDSDVPLSADSATLRLLDAVDGEGRAVVEAAAVLAEPAGGPALTAVSGVLCEWDRVAELVTAGLLGVARDGGYIVAHPVFAQAVYEGLSSDRRRVLHLRAAALTTGDRRLAHRTAAGSGPDAEIADELLILASTARTNRRYAQSAAARELACVTIRYPAEADRQLLEALIDRVAAHDGESSDRLRLRAERAPRGALRSLALGLLQLERARFAEAKRHLEDALVASSGRDLGLYRRAALGLAVLYVQMSDGQAVIGVIETMRQVAGVDPATDPELAKDVAMNLAVGEWLTGDDAGALAELAGVADGRDRTWREAELFAVRGLVHHYRGDLRSAIVDLDASIGLSHVWRSSSNMSRIYQLRSRSRFHLGDWDGAAADAAAGRAIADDLGQPWSSPLARAVSIAVPAWRGRFDDAAEHLAAAEVGLTPELWSSHVGGLVRLFTCDLLEARGDPDALLAELEPALVDVELERMRIYGAHRQLLPAWITAALQAGRTRDAERALARYEGLLVRWSNGPGPKRLGLLRGLVAQARGDLHSARRHYETDFSDPRVKREPLRLGQLHLAAGRLERRAGDRVTARSHLLAAASLFRMLQAAPLLESCRGELGRFGAEAGTTVPPSLTEREDIVASFVCRGFTNKEIARELFVTSKAVEYHLTRIYTKLGVRNRQELRRISDAGSSWRFDGPQAYRTRIGPWV